MKALLLDVGNTRLKWGIASLDSNGKCGIHKTGGITQQKIKEQGLGALTSALPRRVDAVMASNVAGPSFATRLAGWLGAHCNCEVHYAKTTRKALGLTNGYAQPRRMGVDRWVAMLGAWSELQSACLVVDAGTAVTIDAIDGDGQHLGGQILPGVALMTRSLADNTSDIPLVVPGKAAKFDGMKMYATNTRAALVSGALNAVIGAIDRAANTLQTNYGDASLVLTGGDGPRILQALEQPPLHRPQLVLQGLLALHNAT